MHIEPLCILYNIPMPIIYGFFYAIYKQRLLIMSTYILVCGQIKEATRVDNLFANYVQISVIHLSVISYITIQMLSASWGEPKYWY